MKILVIADPVEKLILKSDTSLGLASEFFKRGHEVFWGNADDLTLKGSDLSIQASKIDHIHKFETPKFLKCSRPLIKSFQLILIRKDPPFQDPLYRTLLDA